MASKIFNENEENDNSDSVELPPTFEECFEQYHISLAEGKFQDLLKCVEFMSNIAAPGSIYAEMLNSCKAKGADAVVESLRSQCKAEREALLLIADRDNQIKNLQPSSDAVLDSTCRLAVILGCAKQVRIIFGGLLHGKLKYVSDKAMKRLTLQRPIYRLNQGGTEKGTLSTYSGSTGGQNDLIDETSDAHPHVTALATVFGSAAEQISRFSRIGENSDFLGFQSGPISSIHEDACNAAVAILEWFVSDAGFSKWQKKSQEAVLFANRNSSSPNRGRFVEPSSFDVKAMDFLIDEIALACQLCQRYIDFMAQHCIEESNSVVQLGQNLHSLVGVYVQLEDAYCLVSVQKALIIAEPIEVLAGVFLSSAVEDSSFLLQKSLERSISTCNEQAIMAIVNRIAELLEPHAPPPSLYAGLSVAPHQSMQNKVDIEKVKSSSKPVNFSSAFARALEEAVEGSEVAERVKEGVGGPASREFSRLTEGVSLDVLDDDLARDLMIMSNSAHFAAHLAAGIRATIGGRLEETAPLVQSLLEQVTLAQRAFTNLRDDHLICIVEQIVYPSIEEVLRRGGFGFGQYDIDGTAFEAFVAAGTPAAAALIYVMEQGPLCTVCRPSLDADIFILLLKRTIEGIRRAIEERLLGEDKTDDVSLFSEWGAMLFHREIRTLQQHLGGLVEGESLTQQFSRLQEIAQILTVECPADIPLVKIGSTLSTKDIQKILYLRSDFEKRAVDKALGTKVT